VRLPLSTVYRAAVGDPQARCGDWSTAAQEDVLGQKKDFQRPKPSGAVVDFHVRETYEPLLLGCAQTLRNYIELLSDQLFKLGESRD
jgi:hypothetical protein